VRAVLQRVSKASVVVDGVTVGEIQGGVVLLVAVMPADTDHECRVLVDKVCDLRIFSDESGRMNLSLVDVGGEVLVVSQFTLAGDIAKGRRPSFTGAAPRDVAVPLMDKVVRGFDDRGVRTAEGQFGASMQVSLVNDGPVTFTLDVVEGRVR
jgi:D-tyrosyl-tRNA(Tyr) deacylase